MNIRVTGLPVSKKGDYIEENYISLLMQKTSSVHPPWCMVLLSFYVIFLQVITLFATLRAFGPKRIPSREFVLHARSSIPSRCFWKNSLPSLAIYERYRSDLVKVLFNSKFLQSRGGAGAAPTLKSGTPPRPLLTSLTVSQEPKEVDQQMEVTSIPN